MKQQGSLAFAQTNRDFVQVLNKRVGDYFRVNRISRHADAEMVTKTVCMFAAYWGPYALILTGVVSSWWALLLALAVMSLGLAGIGLSVMHDANHQAYSGKRWINNLLGYSLNLVGANSFNWRIQHNVLHHSYTNVQDADEDIDSRGILRLTPHTAWKRIHRYQYLYAWFLYGLMTLVWMFFKDFVRIIHYTRTGIARAQKANLTAEWVILIGTKLVYVCYIFVVPLLLTDLTWWQIALGIVIMHYVAGFILAIVFQPAHVIEGTEFPLPDETQTLPDNWAVHQLHTTNNFGNKSRWFSWYVGGLNFQIEHHLFPNICHVHYRKIAGIVQATASEFGLPYKSSRTFIEALAGHTRLLRQLGMRPQ
ncbi:MAG: acyl-CoA desaturase [Cyclobacteriaceae bacterium]